MGTCSSPGKMLLMAALTGLHRVRRARRARDGHRLREALGRFLHHADPQHRQGRDGQPSAVSNAEPAAHISVMETLTQPQEATADDYQTALYERTLSIVPEERFAAAREAIATSPYSWINLDSSEGVRELIEGALDDDAILNRALAEVGELEGEDRALLGQYLAETINEIIVEAEASYWLSSYRTGQRPAVPAADTALAYEPNDPKHPGYLNRITA